MVRIIRLWWAEVDSNQKERLKAFIFKGFRTMWQLCDNPFFCLILFIFSLTYCILFQHKIPPMLLKRKNISSIFTLPFNNFYASLCVFICATKQTKIYLLSISSSHCLHTSAIIVGCFVKRSSGVAKSLSMS